MWYLWTHFLPLQISSLLLYFCVICQFLSLYVVAAINGCQKVDKCSWSSWIFRKFRLIFRGWLSDNEDFISRGRLVILPPNDEGDRDTEEDSGNENELLPNNLNRSQLLAGTTVHLSTSSGNILLGAWDEEKVAGPSVDVPSKRNKESKVNIFL